MKLDAIPFELGWLNEPKNYTLEPLSMTAEVKTDWFISPQGDVRTNNAHALLFNADTDFTLSARVTVDFLSSFDAGVLVLYQNDSNWAKLCFELSPDGDPMIVSVVTKGSSDDCNSVFIDSASIYLRIAKMGKAYAFHHSTDGKYWYFVRTFALETVATKAGFLAQSPTGDGCRVSFTDINYQSATLSNLRSGV